MYAQTGPDTPIVQKYGGTSVGDAERITAVAERIARLHQAGHRKLAVVVSARAGETNRLLRQLEEINPKASGRAHDLALAAGEQVSVASVTAALEGQGVAAAPFLAYQLGIRTDPAHGRARIQSIRTEAIEEAWEHAQVAVIAGFQGVSDGMHITTLGRGGSDTSAVALAVALNAGFCEINTDVDGVFTADPRTVPNARLIHRLNDQVALEMAALGSKVLHPRCVELGAKFNMPLVVRNTFKPDDHERTVIMSRLPEDSLEELAVSGVTVDRNVATLTVSGLPAGRETISTVFRTMGELAVNVDVIVHDRNETEGTLRVGFSLPKNDLEQARTGLENLRGRAGFEGLHTESETELAKVSVVGVGMLSYSGVAGRTLGALTDSGIDLHMISTSEIKLSCVVAADEAERAAQALHAEFLEN